MVAAGFGADADAGAGVTVRGRAYVRNILYLNDRYHAVK